MIARAPMKKNLHPTTIEKYGIQLRPLHTFDLERKGLTKRKAKAEHYGIRGGLSQIVETALRDYFTKLEQE